MCSSAGPESLETQVVECGNGIVDVRRELDPICCPYFASLVLLWHVQCALGTLSAVGRVNPFAPALTAVGPNIPSSQDAPTMAGDVDSYHRSVGGMSIRTASRHRVGERSFLELAADTQRARRAGTS